MNEESMTARICAFSRAYHSIHNKVKIFDDIIARQLLTDEEYGQTITYMSQGIKFFNPSFEGTAEEAIRWIVDNQLSPTPLGRATYTEHALKKSVEAGVSQYLILAAGYDTFAYRQPEWANKLQIFEIDHPLTAEDKKGRLEKAAIKLPQNVNYISADFTKELWVESLTQNKDFDKNKMSFCSMLGMIYYLTQAAFENFIEQLGIVLAPESFVVFDYPDEDYYRDTEKTGKHAEMAEAANEKMCAAYSYAEMKNLLERHGFFISEHLNPEEITKQYFKVYNNANLLHQMRAQPHVNYCMAIKRKL